MPSYDEHMERGRQQTLALDVKDAVASFDEAIKLDPESYPKQWMRGIALYFVGRYPEGAHQFEGDLDDNPEDVEEVVWKAMCDMREHGFLEGQAMMLPRPKKDARCPMREIYGLFSGAMNGADVLEAAMAEPEEGGARDTALAYGHLYIGLYLDCLAGHKNPEMLGLIPAARSHYAAAGQKPSDDFMGKLSVAMWRRSEALSLDSNEHACTRMPRAAFVERKAGSYSSGMVGCWQLSAGHHGDAPTTDDLFARLDVNRAAGLTTLDMGDIYTGVEEFTGRWIDHVRSTTGAAPDVEIHTKLVPDLDLLASWSKEKTDAIVQRSLNRLGGLHHMGGKIALVQMHWWQWAQGDHVAAYRGLCENPLVENCGVTNYDAAHLQELLDAGLPVVSNQVQYSVLDRRVEHTMVGVCRRHDVRLLCYGVLAGGFLSDTWLGRADPLQGTGDLSLETLNGALSNRSLIKYYLIIHEFGGWGKFQALLRVLKAVGDRHGASIAAVAQAWVLSRAAVSGVILGLSKNPKHLECARRAYDLAYDLSAADLADIEAASAGNPLMPRVYYALERERDGPHGAIMRYNCGALHSDAHAAEAAQRGERLLQALQGGALPKDVGAWRARNMIAEFEQFPREGQRGEAVVAELRQFAAGDVTAA